jgi:hypothetical protein
MGGVASFVSDVVEGAVDTVGSAVESVGSAVSDVAQSVGDTVSSAAQAIGDAGVSIDQTVNDVIPGGWATVGAIAATVATMGATSEMIPATMAAEGAVEAGAVATAAEVGTEAAVAAGASEAAAAEATAAAVETSAGLAAEGGVGLTSGAVDATLAEGLVSPLSQEAILNSAAQGALKGAAIGGIKTAVTGGDLNQILQGAGYGALAGGAGGAAGNFASQLGANAIGTAITGGVAGGATGALTSGRDPLTGALIGGLTSGVISGASELGGQLGTNPNIDIANNSSDPIGTLNSSQNWTGPMTNNIGDFAQELANQGMSESDIAAKLQSNYGIDQYAAMNAAGMASAGQSGSAIADVLSQDYGQNMTGIDSSVAGPSIDLNNQTEAGKTVGKIVGSAVAPLATGALLGATTNALAPSSGYGSGSAGSSGYSSGASGDTTVYGALPTSLKSTALAAAPVTQGDNMNLNQLKQLYPQLANVDPRILSALTGKTAAPTSYFNYGADQGGATALMQGQAAKPSAGYPSIAANEKAGSENAATFMGDSMSGGFNALSSAGLKSLGATSSSPYNLKNGGGVKGALHIPEFKTGTTGHFVQGEGDGQSDDIPAMLADGEYVFDADTVASLGNGSSKAGALQLDKMREAIRKHKRSAPHNKIPPKAKSPLEYLKGK